MQVKLTEGEQARAAARGTDNLESYLKCLQANELIRRSNIESAALAKKLAEEAIALDPEYAWAYSLLGRIHEVDVWLGTSTSPKQSLAKATELFQKAIALDDNLAEAHGNLSFLYSMTRQHDKAVAQAKKAVALDPNSAEAHVWMGKTLAFAGRDEEAIPEYKTTIRLNPMPPSRYFWSLGLAYGETGQYEEGITWCEKAIRQDPNSLYARVMMTVVYSYSGRDEEARTQAAEVLRINPNFSLEKFAKRADPTLVSALGKAGLK
jgi:adenylate cyclase